jgi:hypothetical protein
MTFLRFLAFIAKQADRPMRCGTAFFDLYIPFSTHHSQQMMPKRRRKTHETLRVSELLYAVNKQTEARPITGRNLAETCDRLDGAR